jgi:RsmE family RNA methyltransferase
VNLLLVDASEIAGDTVVLTDRRAAHLRDVLGVAPGAVVKAGVVGGPIGTATVTSDDGAAIAVRLSLAGEPAPIWPVELVLAVPRPKALTRVIEAAASFGVARIELTNAWRVDKSYLDSPRLEPDALALATRLGAEQGGSTHLPPIAVHRRFMAMIDRPWSGTCVVAHPGAAPIESVVRGPGPTVVAIGPEGGWIQREVETFVERGFTAVSLGAPILRVEAAVAAALAQLLLLHRRP